MKSTYKDRIKNNYWIVLISLVILEQHYL